MAKTKLGIVSYTDSNGFEKPAVVIGTRASIQKGQTIVARPDKGCVNLAIVSPKTGVAYTRFNIPQGEGPRTWRPVNESVPGKSSAELIDF